MKLPTLIGSLLAMAVLAGFGYDCATSPADEAKEKQEKAKEKKSF